MLAASRLTRLSKSSLSTSRHFTTQRGVGAMKRDRQYPPALPNLLLHGTRGTLPGASRGFRHQYPRYFQTHGFRPAKVAPSRGVGRRWYCRTSKGVRDAKGRTEPGQPKSEAARESSPASAQPRSSAPSPSWKATEQPRTPAEALKTHSSSSNTSGSASKGGLPPFTQPEFEAAFYEWFKKDKNWLLQGAPIPKFVVFVSLFYGAMTYASLSTLEKSSKDEAALETSVASAAIVAAEMETQPLTCLASSAGAMTLAALFSAWWVPRRTEKSMNIFAHSYCDRVPKAAVLAQARNAIKMASRTKGVVAAMFLTVGMTFGTVILPAFFFGSYIREMNRIGWDREPSHIPSTEKYRAFTFLYFGTCLSVYLVSLSYSPFVVVPAMMSSIAAFPLLSQASGNIVKVTTRLQRVKTAQMYQELALEDDLLGLARYDIDQDRPDKEETL